MSQNEFSDLVRSGIELYGFREFFRRVFGLSEGSSVGSPEVSELLLDFPELEPLLSLLVKPLD